MAVHGEITMPPDRKRIFEDATREFGVSIEAIIGKELPRDRTMLAARRQVMRRLRGELDYSLPKIGWVMHRDHTTVLYHLRRSA